MLKIITLAACLTAEMISTAGDPAMAEVWGSRICSAADSAVLTVQEETEGPDWLFKEAPDGYVPQSAVSDGDANIDMSDGLIWDFQSDDDRITAIGDSIMVGASDALRRDIPGITIDAAVSRQLSAGEGIVASMLADGTLGGTVIIGLGTNGPFPYSMGQSLLDRIGSQRRVFWVLTCGTAWCDTVNTTIKSLSDNNSNVTMLDWPSAAAAHPGWLGGDGVHPTMAGREGYGQFIADAVRDGVTE